MIYPSEVVKITDTMLRNERIKIGEALEKLIDESSPYRKIAQIECAISKLKKGESI